MVDLAMIKWINTTTHENIKFTLFPDGQAHVDLLNIARGDKVYVVIRLKNSMDLIHLLQISNALDNIGAKKCELHIPYLTGARYDRSMRFGDSVDLKVFAQLINSCNFSRVFIFDVHSDVALQLIERSENISNNFLVKEYNQKDAVLICPDTGAAKKVAKYFELNPNLKEMTYCLKNRDLDTGKISLDVINSEACKDKNCVIIDDLCDGGGTFLAIAKQIKPKHLTLIVSHGIFSKGLRELKEHFDEIITTDSFQYQNPQKQLKVVTTYGH